jgi:hypothetical protein
MVGREILPIDKVWFYASIVVLSVLVVDIMYRLLLSWE